MDCWFKPTQLLFSFAKSQLSKPKVTQRIKRGSKKDELCRKATLANGKVRDHARGNFIANWSVMV